MDKETCNHEWCVTSPIDTVETCRKCGKTQDCLPDVFNGEPPEWWKRREDETANDELTHGGEAPPRT